MLGWNDALIPAARVVRVLYHPFQVPGRAIRKRRELDQLGGEGPHPFVTFFTTDTVDHCGQQVDDIDFRLGVVEDQSRRTIRCDDLNRRAEAGWGVGNRLVPGLE